MKELNEIMNELESLMGQRRESKMKAQIMRIMKRHEFYEKGDINAIIEKSSEEISLMVEKMMDDLYNQKNNNY
jgi:hypothetical protein